MDILVFDKERTDVKLTKHLSLSEYHCKCTSNSDCTKTFVLCRTVRSFGLVRNIFSEPIIINSAFRCQRHNTDVGGSKNSYHKIGAAMDLRPVGDFRVEELDRLDKICQMYFDVALRYEGFIHCHNVGDDNFGDTLIEGE